MKGVIDTEPMPNPFVKGSTAVNINNYQSPNSIPSAASNAANYNTNTPVSSTSNGNPIPSATAGSGNQIYQEDVPVQQGVIMLELGYEQRWLTTQEIASNPIKHYSLLCCCPCMFGNPPFLGQENKDNLKKLKTSFMFWICIVQIIMFIAELCVGGFISPTVNGSLGPSAVTLVRLGGKYTPFIVSNGEVWRLLTCILLHVGIIHIFFNIMAQITIGIPQEFKYGTKIVASTFIFGGILASMMSAVVNIYVVGVGASGAIMALVGLNVAHLEITWTTTDPHRRKQEATQLLVFIVVIIIIGTMPSVDNSAHFTGLFAGILFGILFFREKLPPSMTPYKKLIIAAPIVVLIFLFSLLVGLLATMKIDPSKTM